MASVDRLKTYGLNVLPPGESFARPGLRLVSYPGMGHSTCQQELVDLTQWLVEALK